MKIKPTHKWGVLLYPGTNRAHLTSLNGVIFYVSTRREARKHLVKFGLNRSSIGACIVKITTTNEVK